MPRKELRGVCVFAWYTALSGTLGVTAASKTEVVTANQSSLDSKELTVTWTQVAQSEITAPLSNLVMTDKSADGNVKAYNSAGQLVPANIPEGKTKYAQLSIKLAITDDELLSYAGQKCTVSVSPGSRLKVAGSASDAYNAVAGAAYEIGTFYIGSSTNAGKVSGTNNGSDWAASSTGVTFANVFVALSGDYDGASALAEPNEGTAAIAEAKRTLTVTLGALQTI